MMAVIVIVEREVQKGVWLCTAMTDCEQKNVLELLELYRSLPALWDINSPQYSDRIIKEQQYELLLLKFRQQNPNSEKKDLTRKINTLRSNYRRELKRKWEMEKCGKGVFETSLYYFEALSFLNSDDPETSKSLKKPKPSHSSNPPAVEEPEVKKKKTSNSIDDLVKLATQRLKVPKTSFQLLASVWADKLSRMERTQRIVAEKLINEIMFNGELGMLSVNTSLNNISAPHVNVNHNPSSVVNNEENYLICSGSPIIEQEDVKVEIDENGDIYGI